MFIMATKDNCLSFVSLVGQLIFLADPTFTMQELLAWSDPTHGSFGVVKGHFTPSWLSQGSSGGSEIVKQARERAGGGHAPPHLWIFISVFKILEDEFNENEKCLNLKQKIRKFVVRSQEVLKASHLFPWPFSQFCWVISLHASGKNGLIIQWETQERSQHAILTAEPRACFCVGLVCGFAFLSFNRAAEPHVLLIHYRGGTHKLRSLAFINAISFLFYNLIKIGKIENFWQHR